VLDTDPAVGGLAWHTGCIALGGMFPALYALGRRCAYAMCVVSFPRAVTRQTAGDIQISCRAATEWFRVVR
jgi:hypothetical protein